LVDAADEYSQIIRREWPRVVATLVGDFGDLTEAEDAAQEAVIEALQRWPVAGLPDRPGAWITTVARRRAIDRMRRSATGREKAELDLRLNDRLTSADDPSNVINDQTLLRDEQLRLLFACCHPALAPEAQMALTLRSLGGLTTAEIAKAFVTPEATVAQRLVRAKKKIALAGIPFRIPPDHELLGRTDRVRTIIYLIFNEGYNSTGGDQLVRPELCIEAIRLAGLVAELTPDDPESLGLMALLLLIHARFEARADAAGDLVLLADQDRSAWNQRLIQQGTSTLDRALLLERPGPFQIQAAVNVLHDQAVIAADTDWEQIELLYRRLLAIHNTPVVALNHAVAVAMSGDIGAGLRLLDDPTLAKHLDRYQHYHSARADLLRDRDPEESVAAYGRALDLAQSEPERRFLSRRMVEARQSSKQSRHKGPDGPAR
jgi:RNA polymerase sigma-70 factor (ECF subfamily)